MHKRRHSFFTMQVFVCLFLKQSDFTELILLLLCYLDLESPLTIPFYAQNGFKYSHRIKDFFTDNYDHPIYEDGKQLVDMVYLRKELSKSK